MQGSVAACNASDSMIVYYTPPPPPEKKGAGAPRECNGSNPICGSSGNKYQREVDYQGAGVFPLRFERHYNSAWAEERMLGAYWRMTYDRQLTAGADQVALTRPDGRAFRFTRVGESWIAEADVTERLERLSEGGVFTGWRYTTADDEIEVYDTQGRLVALADRAGLSQTLAYDEQGRLATVTHTLSGGTLRFTYDAVNRLSTLTDPGGGVYRYAYDANNNLISVVYPDATPADPSDAPTRRYHYDTTWKVIDFAG
jgi:YD repeat-containing protein